ncbi:hypothetical protein ACJA25_01440 [Mycoplasmopsis hyopharyngis]|uniref:hypothetical protein n=1 Tax=Mycoplasmopsis hyopharyngis TaxID=29558 RepID=UPI00387332FE
MKLKKKNKIWFVVPLAFASLTTIFPIAARCKKVEENKDDKQGGDSSSNSDSNKKDGTTPGQTTPEPKKPENPRTGDDRIQKDEPKISTDQEIIENLERLTKSFETTIQENKNNSDLKQNIEKINQKFKEIKIKTNEYKTSQLTKEKNEEARKYIVEIKKFLEDEKNIIDKLKKAIVVKENFIKRITKIEDEIYNSSTWFFVKSTRFLNDEDKQNLNQKLIFGYSYAKKIEHLLNIEKISELQEQLDRDLTLIEKSIDEAKDLIVSKFISENEDRIKKLEKENLDLEKTNSDAVDILESKKDIVNNLKKYLSFLKDKKEIIFYSISFESINQIYNEFINLWNQSKFKELKNNLQLNLENYPPFNTENDNNRSQDTLELQRITDALKEINDSDTDKLKQEIIKIFKQYNKITKIWFEKTTIKNECLESLKSFKKLNISKDSEVVKNNEYLSKNIDVIEKDIKNVEEFLVSPKNQVNSLNESLELSSNINKWISRIKNSNRYLKVMNLYLDEKWEIFLKSKSEEIKKNYPNLDQTYKKSLVELLNLFEFDWEKPQSEFNKKFAKFEQLFNKLNETIKQ